MNCVWVGVLLGFYKFNVHNLRADKVVCTPCDLWRPPGGARTTGWEPLVYILLGSEKHIYTLYFCCSSQNMP